MREFLRGRCVRNHVGDRRGFHRTHAFFEQPNDERICAPRRCGCRGAVTKTTPILLGSCSRPEQGQIHQSHVLVRSSLVLSLLAGTVWRKLVSFHSASQRKARIVILVDAFRAKRRFAPPPSGTSAHIDVACQLTGRNDICIACSLVPGLCSVRGAFHRSRLVCVCPLCGGSGRGRRDCGGCDGACCGSWLDGAGGCGGVRCGGFWSGFVLFL